MLKMYTVLHFINYILGISHDLILYQNDYIYWHQSNIFKIIVLYIYILYYVELLTIMGICFQILFMCMILRIAVLYTYIIEHIT